MNNLTKQFKYVSNESVIEVRAALYKLISVAYRYPTDALVKAIAAKEYWNDLSTLTEILKVDRLHCLVIDNMEALQIESKREQLSGFEVEYNQLFQVAKPVECPLTASEYMKGEGRQALAVAQINGLYASFGVKMKESERHDNLSVLLEFMSWICAKELNALVKNQKENMISCINAEVILLSDYLGWLPLLDFAVKSNAKLQFYPWITELLVEFLRYERYQMLDEKSQSPIEAKRE